MKSNIHNEAQLWATTAAAGGLNESEMKAWAGHRAGCPDCQKLYEEEIMMNKIVKKSLQLESPDPGFERRMIAKFRQVHVEKKTLWRDLLSPVPITIAVAACVALVVFCSGGSAVKTDKSAVVAVGGPDLKALPPAVQQTIQSNSEGRTVRKFDRTEDDGEVSYQIETASNDGQEYDLTVAEDGTLLSKDLAVAELPPSVQTAIQAQVGSGTLEGVAKLNDDGETTYQAGIAPAGGVERDFTYAEDGTLLSEEASLDELAPAIQAAITTQVGQGKLEGIDKTYDDREVTYEATSVTPQGDERNFSIAADGTLLSREVSLEEVPASVKQTITQNVGQGKVVEIDQSFVAENPDQSYEIESQKNGKPFDFTISSTGRFLGVEE